MESIGDWFLVNRVQVIAIVVSTFFFLVVVRLVKRKYIRVEYSLLWLSFASLFVIMAIFRDVIDVASDLIGVLYAPAALLLVLVVGAFCILIQFSIVLSRLSEKCRVLTQELAILRQKYDEQHPRHDETP